MRLEDVGAAVGAVLLRVDAVADHAHALRVDCRVAGEKVAAVLGGDGDDRVGRFEGGALAPARERIAAAELLGLPRPQRLEAVHRGDVRHAVNELREVPGEVCVPGVAVDEVGITEGGGHREVDRDRAESGAKRLGPRELLPCLVCDDRGPHAVRSRLAEAVDGHVDEPVELACQVLDVDARAAVDVRWVLAGEEGDPRPVSHRRLRPCRSRRRPRRRRRTARGRVRGRRRSARQARP